MQNTFHRLGPLACSDSELTSETVNPFRHSLDVGSVHYKASIQNSTTQKDADIYIYMPLAGLEHTISVSERLKTVRALDRAATSTSDVKYINKCCVILYEVS
jgi:hypothetical protein